MKKNTCHTFKYFVVPAPFVAFKIIIISKEKRVKKNTYHTFKYFVVPAPFVAFKIIIISKEKSVKKNSITGAGEKKQKLRLVFHKMYII